jgi:hypothetical protein
MNRLVVLLAVAAVMSWAGMAQAQCCGAPVVSYYAPAPTTVYYAAPTTACYAPQAVYYSPYTSYYAPQTSYYAPQTSCYAPQTVYYGPAVGPVVTTRYRPILGGSVSHVYYPAARPWVSGYWPYY